MGKELKIPTKNLPAYLQDYQSDTADSMITGATYLPRISLRGKQFRFRKDDKERSLPLGHTLKVVVVGVLPKKSMSKVFFEDAYSEGSDEAPTCSSMDGIKPDSWVTEPQCKTCAKCPQNQWGSATNSQGQSTKGKACQDTKILVVLAPDDPEGEPWALKIPPASLKALSTYGNMLKQKRIPVEGIITEMQFTESEYPQLEFAYAGMLDDETGMGFIQRVRSEEFQQLLDSVVSTTAEQPIKSYDDELEEEEEEDASPPKKTAKAPPKKVSGIPKFDDEEENPEEEEDAGSGFPAGDWNGNEEEEEEEEEDLRVQAKDGSFKIDKDGAKFDPEKHATKSGCRYGALKQDGTFKARKGVGNRTAASKTAAPNPAAPKSKKAAPPPEADDDLDIDDDELASVLDKFGVD